MATVKGSEEVRTNWGASLDQVHAQGEPVVIQRHGRPYAVLMSYDQWVAQEKMHLAMLRERAAAPTNEFVSLDVALSGLPQ